MMEELQAFTDYYVGNDRVELEKRLEHSLLVMKILDAARQK